MHASRSSGIQLHVTSLPGGRLGPEAHRFVDWLAAAGQSWWQMLPLGPPDRHGSPYKAASAFAAWSGLLERPRAPVTGAEAQAFRERHAGWIAGWERYGGAGAVDDQVRFEREWTALRAHAAERGVRLIGDVPIYVAPGGADHRADPEIFRTDAVAGVPPDAFTSNGQLWGNPLYDWPALRRRRYRWWVQRLRRTFELFDLARVDHFRGFVGLLGGAPRRARRPGRPLAPGPGPGRLRRRARGAGRARRSSPRTWASSRRPSPACAASSASPAWRCSSSRFDRDDPSSPHHPARHERDSVVYTGTHDHDTARGWWESAGEDVRAGVRAALDEAHIAEREPHWALVRLAFSSPARLAMVQAQDVLGLGSEARMNVPGRARGNWTWRMERGPLTPGWRRGCARPPRPRAG